MLPGGMGRHLLAILAVLLVGCDEEDPATSEHCIMVRMRAIELAYAIGQLMSRNSPGWREGQVTLARLQSENWQCFR